MDKILKLRKETDCYENDLSAKEKTENERTRFQKENGYEERQKRSEEKKSKRQKEINCLILLAFLTPEIPEETC